MSKTVTIILVIILLALAYAAYLYFSKPKKVSSGSNGDGSGSGSASNQPTKDYFVNGEEAHDRQVFENGKTCARAIVYMDTRNEMANSILSIMGRPGAIGTCAGFNCPLASVITGLTPAQKNLIIGYIDALNADGQRDSGPTWKHFASLAIGRKNMCSVVLEEAVKNRLPQVWANLGRG